MNQPQNVESIDHGPIPERGNALESNVEPIAPPTPSRFSPVAAPAEDPSGVQRALHAARLILPFAQRLLPLLDSTIVAAIADLFALRPHPNAQSLPSKVDAPALEASLAELQAQQRTLRDQVSLQNAVLRRVEERLEMVRKVIDSNTFEQQQVLDDIKKFGSRARTVAIVGLGLIAFTAFLNLILFLHIQRVLP